MVRKIKDAIIDFAIARGYDGDIPKSIARAIDALAGVSGGGGDSKLVKVTISLNAGHFIADKTNKEIYDLYREGALIYFDIVGDGTEADIHRTITTSYDVNMRESTEDYYVNVYYLYSEDGGMGNWSLKAYKLMSTDHNNNGSDKEYSIFGLK